MNKISESTLVPISVIAALLSFVAYSVWSVSALYVRMANAETNISSADAHYGEILKENKDMHSDIVEMKTILKERGHK